MAKNPFDWIRFNGYTRAGAATTATSALRDYADNLIILFGKIMRRLNQISQAYSFESNKISIWFGAGKMRRLNRASLLLEPLVIPTTKQNKLNNVDKKFDFSTGRVFVQCDKFENTQLSQF